MIGLVTELDAIWWTDPDGTDHPLHNPDTGYEDDAGFASVVQEREGFHMPGVSHATDTVPGEDGEAYRGTRIAPRDLDLGMWISTPSPADLRDRLRAMTDWFPPDADGTLRVIAPRGDVRMIRCKYVSGLNVSESREQGGREWQRLVLQLRAHDPWWTGPEQVALDYVTGPAKAIFPLLPLTLSPSSVLGTTTITNPGQIQAWPVWTITGPGSQVHLVNDTTGLELHATIDLDAGDTLIIDTRPGEKTVRSTIAAAEANAYDTLQAGSSLWPLGRGDTTASLTVTDAAAGTRVQAVFSPRYRSV